MRLTRSHLHISDPKQGCHLADTHTLHLRGQLCGAITIATPVAHCVRIFTKYAWPLLLRAGHCGEAPDVGRTRVHRAHNVGGGRQEAAALVVQRARGVACPKSACRVRTLSVSVQSMHISCCSAARGVALAERLHWVHSHHRSSNQLGLLTQSYHAGQFDVPLFTYLPCLYSD